MSGGSNGPIIVNGGSSDYNRPLCYNAPVDYDSGQFANPTDKTLGQLRRELLVRLGFSAQADNPPQGMVDLLNSFLQSANVEMYERYPQARRVLWFGWQTQVGERFYDIPIDCTKYLDARRVLWAGLQDDETWFPLVNGINPLLFTQTEDSIPQYYEIRQAIEIWPAPDKATYIIWLKAQHGPQDFSLDTDYPAADAQLVLLHALARAKAHYSQPDANIYGRDLEILLGRYTAGNHQTARYIPQTPALVPLPRPIRQP